MHGTHHRSLGAGYRSPDGNERDSGMAQLEQPVADHGPGLAWHPPLPQGDLGGGDTRAWPWVLIALILFCILWRLPSLADPPWLNDEGTYATVGRAIFAGEALYRQIWENKPPAIYLLYGTVRTLV